MNYYEIYDAKTGELLASGTSRECKKKLGCSSIDTFFSLANRSKRGINKKYKVIIKKGGEVEYPVLGKDSPVHKTEAQNKERKMLHEKKVREED